MSFCKRFGKFLFCCIAVAAVLQMAACRPRAVRRLRRVKDISFASVLLKKELVVGVEADIPPFAFKVAGSEELDGFEIEAAREVGKYLGLNVVFKTIDWNQKDMFLKTGQIDCIWSTFSYTKDRTEAYTLSKPYMKTALVIATMDDAPYITLHDIKHKRIGIQNASSMMNSLAELRRTYSGGFNNPVFFDNLKEGLEAIENGEIEGLLYDVLVINTLIHSERRYYRIIGEPVEANDYVIAFRKNDIALKNKVDEAVDYLAANDILERISRKWFGGDVSVIRR